MNDSETQRFNDLYNRFEAGNRGEALEELRHLTDNVDDPWDKAELIYHEIMFLLEMGEVSQASQRLIGLAAAIASLSPVSPPDGYQLDVRISLPVMARYAELKVKIAEGKEAEALRALEDLVSRYPKQLSTSSFRTIFEEIDSQHGFLLADLGRWEEAKPVLERASPPEMWKGVLSYYLGHCYYNDGDYQRAKGKLLEALKQGLPRRWEAKTHYVLGIVYYHFSDVKSAKNQFELCADMADPEYLRTTKIWEWLEAASRQLGLQAEAENYRKNRVDLLPGSKVN